MTDDLLFALKPETQTEPTLDPAFERIAKEISAMPSAYAELRNLLNLLPLPMPVDPYAIRSAAGAEPAGGALNLLTLLGSPPGTTPLSSIGGIVSTTRITERAVLRPGWQRIGTAVPTSAHRRQGRIMFNSASGQSIAASVVLQLGIINANSWPLVGFAWEPSTSSYQTAVPITGNNVYGFRAGRDSSSLLLPGHFLVRTAGAAGPSFVILDGTGKVATQLDTQTGQQPQPGWDLSPSGRSVISSTLNSPYWATTGITRDSTGQYYRFTGALGGTPPAAVGAFYAPQAVAFHPSGNYVAVGWYASSGGSPFIRVYNWSDTNGWGSAVSDPVSVPSWNVTALAWNPAGTKLAVGYGSSPYVTCYDWSNGAWGSRWSDPATPAGGIPKSVAWSPDGAYVGYACDSTASTRVIVYPASGTSFGTAISAPGSLPVAAAYDLGWSPDGTHIFLHSTAATGSYEYIHVYPWSAGAFGTKVSYPTGVTLNQTGSDANRGPGQTYWLDDADLLSFNSATSYLHPFYANVLPAGVVIRWGADVTPLTAAYVDFDMLPGEQLVSTGIAAVAIQATIWAQES